MTFSVEWFDADGNEVVSFPATGYLALQGIMESTQPGDVVTVTRTDGVS